MSVSGAGGRDLGGIAPGVTGDRYDTTPRPGPEGERTLGELFGSLTSDLSELMRSEMELAKVELKEEAGKAGKAAGMLGAGALLGYLALTLVAFAAAWGLAEVIDAGWAFLVVGIVVGAVAAALALTGKKRLDTVSPVPDQTVETLKEDARWARAQVK